MLMVNGRQDVGAGLVPARLAVGKKAVIPKDIIVLRTIRAGPRPAPTLFR